MEESKYEWKEAWYLSNSKSSESMDLHIYRVGHNIAKPGYKQYKRVQAQYSLLFIMQGSLNFSFLDHSIQLHAGDMFILFKENRYAYEMINAELPLQKIWLNFQCSQIDWLLEQLHLSKERPYLQQVIKHNARSLLYAILKTMKENKDPDHLLIMGMFYQLLSHVKQEGSSHTAQNSPHWLELAKHFMDMQYNEHITLDDVCKHVNVSRSHFSEIFLKQFSITPSRYIKDLRMKRARQLIDSTSFTITEIADSVGYQSLFAFSRAFRNYYGYSPNSRRESATPH